MSSTWLHTSSEYIEVFSINNPDELRTKSVDYLAGAEQSLYAMIQTYDYESFMLKLREEFFQAGEVRNALKNFKSANLVINLGLPKAVQFVDQDVEFVLTSEVSPDLAKIITEQLTISNDSIRITSTPKGEFKLSFKYNEGNIKSFLNTYYQGKRRFRDSKNERRSEKTNTLRYANRAFKDLISNNKLGNVVVNGKQIDSSFKIKSSDSLASNFRFRKADLDLAKKNTPEALALREQILSARTIIHDKLKSFMNGIPDLERAFDIAWGEKMGGESDIELIISKFNFFAKGDNLLAGASGAVQELYTAILAEYINIKSEKGISGPVAKVLGNIASGGEQPKRDVEILKSIGIQVKAYSMDRVLTRMSTNIHPSSLGVALGPYGNDNIADTIVQLVFNSSAGNYKDIEKELEPALAQLMSMTASEQVEDTVCFYLVDAQFLVPGSEILSTLRASNYQITIRTNHIPQTDEYFRKEEHERKDGSLGPNFLTYFNGVHAGTFTEANVTDSNEKLYDSLMNNDISIDVKFDYSFMGSARYSIY